MPLIVICGYPSSGKSTWATKLSDYIKQEYQKEVTIVREEELLRGDKNEILDDSRKEKELRAKVKSESQRLLNKETVVIIDALNYIKGYRYELFCMSKAVPTRQVTVQPDVPSELAWQWNEGRDVQHQYKREVFDHIIDRFELPDSQNRWDSPYFNVLPGEELDLKGVCTSLFFNRAPKQNMSTQNRPVSESNFLTMLEKVTSAIIQTIIANKNVKSDDDEDEDGVEEIEVPYATVKLQLCKLKYQESVSTTQLTKLKRQFVNLAKTSITVKGESNIGDMFVQYLNSQCNNQPE